MTPIEKEIVIALIEDWAAMIGLKLEETDVDNMLEMYQKQKRYIHDIQFILLDALYSIQEERVEKSSLVLN